uniref:Uncharacterized protein n=1 Tax=Glossina austeni TaxID=7395 RepID=A0A1A9UPG5_GLOAU
MTQGGQAMSTCIHTKLRKSPTKRHKGIVIVVITSSNALKPIAPLQAGDREHSCNRRPSDGETKGPIEGLIENCFACVVADIFCFIDNERTVLRCNLNKRDYVFKSFLNISISIELKL